MNFVGGSKGDAEDAKEERSRGPSDEYGDHSPDESGEGSMDLMALKWSFAQQAVETPEQKKKEDEKKRLVKEKTRARLEASLTKAKAMSSLNKDRLENEKKVRPLQVRPLPRPSTAPVTPAKAPAPAIPDKVNEKSKYISPEKSKYISPRKVMTPDGKGRASPASAEKPSSLKSPPRKLSVAQEASFARRREKDIEASKQKGAMLREQKELKARDEEEERIRRESKILVKKMSSAEMLRREADTIKVRVRRERIEQIAAAKEQVAVSVVEDDEHTQARREHDLAVSSQLGKDRLRGKSESPTKIAGLASPNDNVPADTISVDSFDSRTSSQRGRSGSEEYYLAPLETTKGPTCAGCDATEAEIWCEDCKLGYCNINGCNREFHKRVSKARHFKRRFKAKSLRFSCMVDCYLCGTQYSTASLPIHYESCKIKWLYNCSQLPTSVRPGPIEPPTLPIPDETSTSPAEIKAFNEESVRIYREFSLISCPYPDCMRKMEPSSVLPHMAACGKRPINANRLGASPTSPDGFANQTMHG